MASTKSLQTTINFTSTQGELNPLSGVAGYNDEPALSFCNHTMQELLSHPHDWKFNRAEMPFFVTANYQQDYLFAGATAFTLGANSAGAQIDLASNQGISVSGGVVTVNIIQGQLQHQIAVGATVYMTGVTMNTGVATAYNSTQTQTGSSWTWTNGWVVTAVTPTSFSFATTSLPFPGQHNGETGGAPGITDFGWLASGTRTELNNNSPVGNIHPMEAVRNLQLSQRVNQPSKFCVIQTYQNAAGQDTGVIRIRLEFPCGANVWMINPVYQMKASLFTTLNATWAPFPDEYSYVYEQGIIAQMYRFLNSPQQVAEYQKFQQTIQKATGADDREQSDVHVYPEQSLIDSGGWGGM